MPEFTPEEKHLISRYRNFSRGDAWGWILVFLPLIFFAAYGFAKKDVVAIFIAWAGTTAWLAWWLIRGFHNAEVFRSVLQKYENGVAESSAVVNGGH